MIVVEGPDGSGKTTLIQRLVDWRPQLEVAPRVVGKDTKAMVDLKQWVEENAKRGWHETIYDRHRLFSEPVYGPLLRDEPQPGFDDFTWFAYHLGLFYSKQPVVIYCLPPLEVIMANVEGDVDNEVIVNFSREIYGAYVNKAATEMIFRDFCYTYDYSAEDAEDQLDMILTGIATRIDMEASYDVPTP